MNSLTSETVLCLWAVLCSIFAYVSGCGCPLIFSPVCGPNGQTYPNQCVLHCAGYSLYTKGMCSESIPPAIFKGKPESKTRCACPRTLNQVCGTDGVTYNNECLLNCAGVSLAAQGECSENNDVSAGGMGSMEESGTGPNDADMMSGGSNSDNEKPMGRKASGGERSNKGRCPSCSQTVQGSGYCANGVTYPNKCVMHCVALQQGVNLNNAQQGACKGGHSGDKAPAVGPNGEGLEVCLDSCHRGYVAVCGEDGMAYPSPCALKCFGVKKAADQSTCSEMAGHSMGLCACNRMYAPVCDVKNSKTYGNRCLLGCAAKMKAINEVTEGECPDSPRWLVDAKKM